MGKTVLGFVCTGNSCRSPVLEWWVNELILEQGLTDTVETWSAGLKPDQAFPIAPQAVTSVVQWGPSLGNIRDLSRHTATHIDMVRKKTDWLFWVTDFGSMRYRDGESAARLDRVLDICQARSAELVIVPESDRAFDYWKRPDVSQARKEAKYAQQALRLKRYASAALELLEEPYKSQREISNRTSRINRVLLIG